MDTLFTELQQKFLSEMLEGLKDYIGSVETSLNDLGRDFTALKWLLEEKNIINSLEVVERIEKAEEDMQVVKIVMQNKQFFDDLRRRLGQSE